MPDIESFPGRVNISFTGYEDILLYLYVYSKNRLLLFTRLLTSKAMNPAPLKTKHIIAEFNREPTNSEKSKNIDLTSEGGEADLDQNNNSKNDL